jgi:hypothetical protein
MWCSFYNARTKKTVLNLILSTAMLWLAERSAVASQSVTLSWNPSEVANVAGYKIYYGTTSLNYSNVVVVGNTNLAMISGLVAGTTYYFAASTLDAAGNESTLSNEANFTLPVPMAKLAGAERAAGQFSFTVDGVTGLSYVVQASSDLRDWAAVATNTAPFVFVEANPDAFARRFYRTVEAGNGN